MQNRAGIHIHVASSSFVLVASQPLAACFITAALFLLRVEEAPSDCEDVVAGVNHVIILDVEGRLLQIDIKCLADCKLVGASDMSLSKGIALLNEASGRVRDLEGHISTLV